jgi:large subunit ribosomal protein L15
MLHSLRPTPGSRTNKKRVARGNSAGGGTTAGKGTKGQDARTGKGKRYLGFEGGQTPLVRRQPKLGGFTSTNRTKYEVINLSDIEQLDAGSYNSDALKAAKILCTKRPVKLLGNGTVTKKFELTVHAASKSAVAAVAKAGGSIKIA